MQQIIQNYLQRVALMGQRYLNYAIRNNPFLIISADIISTLKQFLTAGKRKKMAEYRVNSTIYKAKRMEQLIAESNEHLFLQGRKINELR